MAPFPTARASPDPHRLGFRAGSHRKRAGPSPKRGEISSARRRRRSIYGRISAFRLPQVDRATAVDGSMRLNSMVSASPSTKVVIDKVSPSMPVGAEVPGELTEELLLQVEPGEELLDRRLLKRRVILIGDLRQVRGESGEGADDLGHDLEEVTAIGVHAHLGQFGEKAVPIDPVGAGGLEGELLYYGDIRVYGEIRVSGLCQEVIRCRNDLIELETAVRPEAQANGAVAEFRVGEARLPGSDKGIVLGAKRQGEQGKEKETGRNPAGGFLNSPATALYFRPFVPSDQHNAVRCRLFPVHGR